MKQLIFLFSLIILFGCKSTKAVYHIPIKDVNKTKKLVVFMDGTMNNASSYTNVSKLYNLTILQDEVNINATYIVGVGNHGLGLMTGVGIGKTVRDAYLFISKNYHSKHNDEIYIFGFSRGAYAARILAGMIHVAGITDLSAISEKDQEAYVKKIYKAYSLDQTIYNRRENVSKVTGEIPKSVNIEFLGLWETVEALGIPNFKEGYNVPNKKYVDQLCNVKKAAHALSINDDRATIFTPKLLTEPYLISKCEKPVNIDKIVNEVWFSGSHSDVGGGYGDTEIDGLSLNWMINEIKPYHLLPETTKIFEDKNGEIHDPANGLIEIFYKRKFRNMKIYSENSTYNKGVIKVNKSVISRLSNPDILPFQDFEHNLPNQFPSCFQQLENGTYLFVKSKVCPLEIVTK